MVRRRVRQRRLSKHARLLSQQSGAAAALPARAARTALPAAAPPGARPRRPAPPLCAVPAARSRATLPVPPSPRGLRSSARAPSAAEDGGWLLRGKLALPPPCREGSAAGRRPFVRPPARVPHALSAPRRSCRRSPGRWQRLPAARRRAAPLPTPLTVPRRSPSRLRWTPRRRPRAGGGSGAAASRPSAPPSASPAAAWGRRRHPTPTPACWRRPRPPRGGAASSR